MIKYLLLLTALALVQAKYEFHPDCPPAEIHFLLPHEYDCTKFYYCEYGFKYIEPRDCAPGTEFNYEKQVCVHKDQSTCHLPGYSSTSGPGETAGPTDAPPTPGPTAAPPTPGPTDAPPTPGPTAAPPTPEPTAAPPTPGPTAAPPTPGPTAAPPTPGPTAAPPTPGPTAAPPNPGPTAGPPAQDDCETLENGCPADFDVHKLLPHEEYCHAYYQCDNGEKVLRYCGKGTYFNPKTELCDWPENVDCVYDGSYTYPTTSAPVVTDKPTTLPWEALENGCPADFEIHHLLPHERYCNLYYQCVWGQTVESACAAGTYFNFEIQACDWPENVNCDLPGGGGGSVTPGAPESSEEIPNPGDNGGWEPLPNGCPADFEVNHLLPHESDCNKYYACAHGQKIESNCPAGLHFSPTAQRCDWPRDAGCEHYEGPICPTPNPGGCTSTAAPETSTTTTAPVTPSTTTTTAAPVTPETTSPSTTTTTAAPLIPETTSPTAAPVTPSTTTTTAAPLITETTSPTAAPVTPSTTTTTAAPLITETTSPTAAPVTPSTTTTTAAPLITETTSPTAAPVTPSTTTTTAAPLITETTSPTAAPVTPSTTTTTAAPLIPETTSPTAAPVTPSTTTTTAAPVTPSTTTTTAAPVTPSTQAPDDCEILDNGCPADFDVDKLLPHEEYCHAYYQCDNGEKVLRYCAKGTYFNPILEICDWPENVDCAYDGPYTYPTTSAPVVTDRPTTPPWDALENGCPADFDVHHLLPHETYCNKYYQCVWGQKIETICAAGTYFNFEVQTCDWPENVDCDLPGGVATPPTTGAPVSSEEIPNPGDNGGWEPLPNGCPADFEIDHLLPHESDCNKFYHCVHGDKLETKCPAGLHFSPTQQICDWPRYAGCEHYEGPGCPTPNPDGGCTSTASPGTPETSTSTPVTVPVPSPSTVEVPSPSTVEVSSSSSPAPTSTSTSTTPAPITQSSTPEPVSDSTSAGLTESTSISTSLPVSDSTTSSTTSTASPITSTTTQSTSTTPEAGCEGCPVNPADKCKDECNVAPWAHEDCDKFWICNGDQPLLVSCSEGLYFNPTTYTCDFHCNVPCVRNKIQATADYHGVKLFLPWSQVDENVMKALNIEL